MRSFSSSFPTAFLFILTLGGMFQSCSTPYQPQGFRGGYSETLIQEGIYRVSFEGNGSIASHRAADFALLRSAELALGNGYPYFTVLEDQTGTLAYRLRSSPVHYPSGGIHVSGGQGGTSVAGYSAVTMPFEDSDSTYFKPGSELLIQCFEEKPLKGDGLVFDAEKVSVNIRQQYGLKPRQVQRDS